MLCELFAAHSWYETILEQSCLFNKQVELFKHRLCDLNTRLEVEQLLTHSRCGYGPNGQLVAVRVVMKLLFLLFCAAQCLIFPRCCI